MKDWTQWIFGQVAAGELPVDTGLALLEAMPAGTAPHKRQDIAVIGLSMRMPGANSLEQFWHNLIQRRDCVREYPAHRRPDSAPLIRTHTTLETEEIVYAPGGYLEEVDKFDSDFFQLSPMEAALMDPNQRMFLESCWSAIEDAGYGGSRLQGSRTGVYIGHADWPVYGQYITKTQPSRISMAGVGNTPSILASRISYLLDLRGPSLLIDTACSSSLVAVHTACKAIQNGDCDMAITGGVKLCLMPVAGVFEIGIESSRARTSTFDEHADGTVWGEGAAALLLKPLEQALADSDQIYAVIKGSAMNQDGASAGITAPNAAAQEELLCRAWEDAGVHPESITLFEAHGTGTRLGDPIEIDGIQRAFQRYTSKKQFCAIGSVKTNIGHLDGLSGIAGLLKGIAALHFKQKPPTLHFTRPNRSIPFADSPVYVQDRLAEWEATEYPRRCGVSSFGFSGTNCHVVLEEAPAETAGVGGTKLHDTSGGSSLYVLPISAKREDALKEWAAAYAERLREAGESLADICCTASTGRGHYTYRLAVIGREKQEIATKLESFAQSGLPGDDVYFGLYQEMAHTRTKRHPWEITPSERREYSRQADALLQQLGSTSSADYAALYDQLAEHYIRGADVDWSVLYATANCRKARLPTYPFRRIRCWVDDRVEQAGGTGVKRVHLTGRTNGMYTPEEQLLGQVWGELLGLDTVDIEDDFYDIGGNSIQAIKLEVDLSKSGITLGAEQIEVERSIKQLALRIAGQVAQTAAAARADDWEHSKITIAPAAVREAAATSSVPSALTNNTAVVIPNMEPFNDVFFKNCFYNSLFPVVRHYGGSELPIVLNELAVFTKNDSQYEVAYVPSRPDEDVFAEAGVQVIAKRGNERIMEDIQTEIASGHPVIAWVDAYELSIRKDAYQKEHMDHTLLIYGFDASSEQVHVIEHDRRENLSYRHQQVSFEDLVRGCRAFAERYLTNGAHTATHYLVRPVKQIADEQARTEEQVRSDSVRAFAVMLAESEPLCEQSEWMLAQFAREFAAATADEAHLQACVEEWAGFLNQVMNSKQVELYRLRSALGEQHEIIQTASQLRQSWDTVRKGVVRYLYLPVYDVAVLQGVSSRLQQLVQLEKQFRLELNEALNNHMQKTWEE